MLALQLAQLAHAEEGDESVRCVYAAAAFDRTVRVRTALRVLTNAATDRSARDRLLLVQPYTLRL
jgi:hypothetical protein